jgi:hypothetical protein
MIVIVAFDPGLVARLQVDDVALKPRRSVRARRAAASRPNPAIRAARARMDRDDGVL